MKWNTIPSEIVKINRLLSRTLFPGQVLYVPDKNYVPSLVANNSKKEGIKPSPKNAESNLNIISENAFKKDDEEYMQRWFLKLDSQLITKSCSIIDGFLLM